MDIIENEICPCCGYEIVLPQSMADLQSENIKLKGQLADVMESALFANKENWKSWETKYDLLKEKADNLVTHLKAIKSFDSKSLDALILSETAKQALQDYDQARGENE